MFVFRDQLLKDLYKDRHKSHIAKLCKELAEKAYEGDPLCQWVFEQAGRELAKHLQTVAKGAQKVRYHEITLAPDNTN